MPILSRLVTVTTNATLVATNRLGVARDDKAVLFSEPSADIFVGGPGVTAAAGTRVAVGSTLNIDLGAGDEVFAIASSGTPTVRVLTTRDAQFS